MHALNVLSILLKSYWNIKYLLLCLLLSDHSFNSSKVLLEHKENVEVLNRAFGNLSILLKSYWNIVSTSSLEEETSPFNSSKVLLEPRFEATFSSADGLTFHFQFF